MSDSATVILRLPAVLRRVGLKTTRIYQLCGEGAFPAPVRIGARSVGWVEAEIEQWLQNRIAQSRVQIKTRAHKRADRVSTST